MQQYILFFFIIFFMFSCQSPDNTKISKNTNNAQTSISEEIKTIIDKEKKEQLIIEGKNIWVRNSPINGDVILKLNSGDICNILEIGKEMQIENIIDKWYKIEFNDTIGWVFGSQTNIKTEKNLKIEKFDIFIKKNANNILKQNFSNLIHKKIGINIFHNPGVYSVVDTVENSRISLNDSKIKPESIFNIKPKGNICDAYINTKNGIYYWQIKEKDLPISTNIINNNEVKSEKLELPKQYKNNKIFKVQIIENEHHKAYFFFINIGSSWYLLCEDYVDCSA